MLSRLTLGVLSSRVVGGKARFDRYANRALGYALLQFLPQY